jgi:hypothetical protein
MDRPSNKHCLATYTNPKIASIIAKRFFQSRVDVGTVRGFLQVKTSAASGVACEETRRFESAAIVRQSFAKRPPHS